MRRIVILIPLLIHSFFTFAQQDSTKSISIAAYMEMYYSYDFSNPINHEKEGFIYNHKRHNEINANLLLINADYHTKNTRAKFGLMAGNYAQYNLQAEPTWAQFINEANIGVKLLKNNNLWLDIGILPSHIGFESAISADCWTLTRSVAAENSPYYESGLKVGYTNQKENLALSFLVLNGWQHIQKPNFINRPSIGLQVNYKPIETLTINYSNFIGSDKPDSLHSLRVFHNLYAQYESQKKLSFIAGFDIGTEKYRLANYKIWYSPVIIARYRINNKIKLALRAEQYHDKHQIIVNTNTQNGFQLFGLSSNIDYRLNSKMQTRLECKYYNSKDTYFQNSGRRNFSITTNLTLKL